MSNPATPTTNLSKPAAKPLEGTIPAAPKIAGVTTTQREARLAEERPPSERTLSIMPSIGDLAKELGIKGFGKAAPAPAEEEEEAGAGEEETEEEPAEEEAGADAGTEEEEETEGESEEEEPAEPAEEELPPEAVQIRDSMQKRIDKLTARNKDLDRQLEEQLAENWKLEHSPKSDGPAAAPDSANPLSDVTTESELQARLAEARAVKQWALRNRSGGEIAGKDGAATYFDADQVATFLANAEQVLDAVPARQHWLEEANKAEAMAKEQAPMFFQKGTESHKAIDAVMATVPAAVKAWRPDIKFILIQALVGAHVLGQAKTGAGAKPAKPSVKPVPASPGGRTAPKTTTKIVETRKAKADFQKGTGTVRDIAKVLMSRLG